MSQQHHLYEYHRHPAKEINRASRQIVKGEYDEAIVSLLETLRNLKIILEEEDHRVSGERDHDDDNKSWFSSSRTGSSVSVGFDYNFFPLSPSSSSFLETATTASTTTVLPIFRRPILVCARGGGGGGGDCDYFLEIVSLDVDVCEQLSCVTIYNIALAYHLKSVQLSRRIAVRHRPLSSQQQERQQEFQRTQRRFLRKALSLYECSNRIFLNQATNFIGDGSSNSNGHSGGPSCLHSLALAGNLGQIHHALGNHRKAEECMQQLLKMMMYVVDCRKGNIVDEYDHHHRHQHQYDHASTASASASASELVRNNNSAVMDGFFSMVKPLISRYDPAPAA